MNPDEYLIQDFLDKNSITYCATIFLNRSNNVCSYLLHKRVYEYPIKGGPSTQRESVFNFELINYSIEILKYLKWEGIAMLEWKHVLDQDKYYLIEINPRPGGSIVLDEKTNSQILLNYCRHFQKPNSQRNYDEINPYYKLNVKSTWMIPGDFLRYFSMSKSKRENFKDFLKAQYYC